LEWLHPETKRSIWGIISAGLSIILILAGLKVAGPVGNLIFKGLSALFGWGYFILPLSLLLASVALFASQRQRMVGLTFIVSGLLVLSFLGLVEILFPKRGGWMGILLGSLKAPFGEIAAIVINVIILIISILVALNIPLKITFHRRKKDDEESEEEEDVVITGDDKPGDEDKDEDTEDEEEPEIIEPATKINKKILVANIKDYAAPPLNLLKSSTEKPTTGDLRANANVIKRTLESFGIQVDMGEINIGPKVTRYTLKPAEGIKLSRITALNQDLALALATHPIRIEAPIPGKSLIGIEVPNKAAALVRLGGLIIYPEFQGSGLLGFVLGRNVSGEPVFASIDKMPHLLVAGATGSGKSIMVHSIITSLLYKNSPATLRFILIDPKRVELSIYENLPHLATPVITENKKAISALKWAISEMERRYEILLAAGRRDIGSYNKNGPEEKMPYLVIVVDELADLMSSYGREVEGSIVRLAQMARATGIHLILSTQRPSVEVITGLIKANITSRIALQVASQIDSRTIIDTSGAEKLLGGGDLLYVSSDLSKPKRIQGAYISEDEIKKVADFIKKNNQPDPEEEIDIDDPPSNNDVLDGYIESGEEDELYDDALDVVRSAGRASASLLQRRLKVGYARAARLLDMMEEAGLIGPGEGAKPRDLFIEKIDAILNRD